MDASTPAGNTVEVTGDGAADGGTAVAVRVGAAVAGDKAEGVAWLPPVADPQPLGARTSAETTSILVRFLNTAPTVVIVAPSGWHGLDPVLGCRSPVK